MTHTDEFLIEELQRFYRENNRVPIACEMSAKQGYPAMCVYQSHFGSWNKGLIAAKLEINTQGHIGTLDGTETCSYCGCYIEEAKKWCYDENNVRYCMKHGQHGKPSYVRKQVDPKSIFGKIIVSQRVVANVLNLEMRNDCNCSISHTYPFDLYDKNKYNYINVKDSKLYCNLKRNPYWFFTFANKITPDTYILVGFDEERKNILKIWITNAIDDLVFNDKTETLLTSKTIYNTFYSLKKAKPWEVDAKPYNDMLHKMSEKRKETNGEGCILDNSNLNKGDK